MLLYRRLVVQGPYRYMRNPMFWGALCVVFGEALVFNSLHLLYYFLVVVAMQLVHVPLNEERWLRRRFGAEYEESCRHALPNSQGVALLSSGCVMWIRQDSQPVSCKALGGSRRLSRRACH